MSDTATTHLNAARDVLIAPAPTAAAVAAPAAVPPPSTFKGPKVLACTECDFECDITEVRKLNTHTIHDHKRRPTVDEKTPVPAGAAR